MTLIIVDPNTDHCDVIIFSSNIISKSNHRPVIEKYNRFRRDNIFYLHIILLINDPVTSEAVNK